MDTYCLRVKDKNDEEVDRFISGTKAKIIDGRLYIFDYDNEVQYIVDCQQIIEMDIDQC